MAGPRRVPGFQRPGLHLEAALGDRQPADLPPGLMVAVGNTGSVPAANVTVHWVFENEAAQPLDLGGFPIDEVGGSTGFVCEESFDGTLGVGEVAGFRLGGPFHDSARSRAAALSPERYWVSIRSGDREVVRLDGRLVGGYLDAPPVA